MRGAGYPREVKVLVRLEVMGVVADAAPSSGKGVRYGAFGGGGVTAMIVEVLLGVGRFEGHCDLAEIFFSKCLSNAHPWAGRCSRQS